MTLSIMTFSIMTFSIMTLSITIKIAPLIITILNLMTPNTVMRSVTNKPVLLFLKVSTLIPVK